MVALTPVFIPCVDADQAMSCERCNGVGCYRCEAQRSCDGCRLSLRIGLFDGEQTTCKTCLRKKYIKRTALNNVVTEVSLPTGDTDIDIDEYIKANVDAIRDIVKEAVKQHKSVKVYITLEAELSRSTETGVQTIRTRFQTPIQLIGGGVHDLNFDEFTRSLNDALDRFTHLGSGYTLDRILKCTVHILKYRPLVGSSYIPTPKKLAGKHAIVNPQNEDNQCFKWAVLAGLYPAKDHVNRISNYRPHENKVDWSMLKFPVSLRHIRQFERVNTEFTVNVYSYEDKDVIPVYVTK